MLGKFSQMIRAYVALKENPGPTGAVGRWRMLVDTILRGDQEEKAGSKAVRRPIQNWEKLVGRLLSQFMFSDALNPSQYKAAKKAKKKEPRKSGAIERWGQLTAVVLESRLKEGQRITNNKLKKGFQGNGWERLTLALVMQNATEFHPGTLVHVRLMQDQAEQ